MVEKRKNIIDEPPIDEVIKTLKNEGSSIMETIKFVRKKYSISLKEAKLKVSNHPAWSEFAENSKELHEVIEKILNED